MNFICHVSIKISLIVFSYFSSTGKNNISVFPTRCVQWIKNVVCCLGHFCFVLVWFGFFAGMGLHPDGHRLSR